MIRLQYNKRSREIFMLFKIKNKIFFSPNKIYNIKSTLMFLEIFHLKFYQKGIGRLKINAFRKFLHC